MKKAFHSLLDDPRQIRALDTFGMEALLRNFAGQVEEARRIGASFRPPPLLHHSFDKIVFVGMGGSAIGGDILRSLLAESSSIPFTVCRHYRLPSFVDSKTLCIFSSYSGNTEETLSAFQEALKMKLKGLVLTSGGELAKWSERKAVPSIQIPTGFPPRLALGYAVFPLLHLFSELKLWKFNSRTIAETQGILRSLAEEYGLQNPTQRNLAKRSAQTLFGRLVVVYAGTGLLDSAALRFRNQVEENAKALASHHLLPEMNHNEILGWKFPREIISRSVAVFFRDAGDHPRIRRRMEITRRIIQESGARVLELHSHGKTSLARLFSIIYLGDWISFYLALLYGEDPTPVQVIEFLKKELAGVRSRP